MSETEESALLKEGADANAGLYAEFERLCEAVRNIMHFSPDANAIDEARAAHTPAKSDTP